MIARLLYYCAIGFFVAAISDCIEFPNRKAKFAYRLILVMFIYIFAWLSHLV